MSEYARHHSNAQVFDLEHSNSDTGELFLVKGDVEPQAAEEENYLPVAVSSEIQEAALIEDHLRDLGVSQARIDKEVALGRRMLKLIRGGHDISRILPSASSSGDDVVSDDFTTSKESAPIVQKREYRDIASAAANDHD